MAVTEAYKKLVYTEGLSKLEWLNWRQKGIGGSDIASVCGINPWKSSLALYYEKTQQIKEDGQENLPAELGTYLEPFMKRKFEKWFNENEGTVIEAISMPWLLQSLENPIMLANIDGWSNHPTIKVNIVIEYKTTSERNYKEWQEDNLPDYYYLQAQHYLYVTGAHLCYLPFLIGNRKFDVKIIQRNEEVIKQIVEKANYFWNNFVIPKIPPAPDGTESSGEVLSMLYPKEEEGKIITLEGEEYLKAINDLEELKLKKKEAELNIDRINQIFKAKMGTAEIAICGSKKITWKEQERKEYIVRASKSRVFRISNYKGGNGND